MKKLPANEKLRAWRLDAGMTQRQAAAIAGVSHVRWGQFERNVGSVKKLVAMGLETLTEGAVVACDWK